MKIKLTRIDGRLVEVEFTGRTGKTYEAEADLIEVSQVQSYTPELHWTHASNILEVEVQDGTVN